MITFGPVPSRRLGRSLGINNIPPKNCSYSCVYCQIGRTLQMLTIPQEFYSPIYVFEKVREKVKLSREKGEVIDYLTFVPDGEPTLDIHLGEEIKLVKSLGIKTAVITNASFIDKESVRKNLTEADLVSLKIDSTEENIWRKIDRPHRNLRLDTILMGVLQFSKEFKGEIFTETMLIRNLNDSVQNIEKIANFLVQVKPERSFLSIPIRPPAEKWVQLPSEECLNRSYNLFKERLNNVEYLIGYEGNEFSCTGIVEEDILSITSVHPMTTDALNHLLQRTHSDWSVISALIDKGQLSETEYKGQKFYVRKF